MSELVARTGRHQQRYESGCRLIAGYHFEYFSEYSSIPILQLYINRVTHILFPQIIINCINLVFVVDSMFFHLIRNK